MISLASVFYSLVFNCNVLFNFCLFCVVYLYFVRLYYLRVC